MDSLNAIVGRDVIAVPTVSLDGFQSEVLRQLHLEFFFAKCRVLITPHLRFETTGESTASEEATLQTILDERQELLSQLKLYLLYNLSLYSALLETNSYYIAANDHLLISRFVEFGGHPGFYEVKLYTLPREDLLAHYSDKIYLGRDFISLDSPQRAHFGLRHLIDSLRQQLPKLSARIDRHAPRRLATALQREQLRDLREAVAELEQRAAKILNEFPSAISTKTLERSQLLDLNGRFRDLKHLLSETDDTLQEMEARLLEQAPHAARYVTKLRKDVGNDINYLMLKVNGWISDAVNGIRI
jgi:hypothetical protein